MMLPAAAELIPTTAVDGRPGTSVAMVNHVLGIGRQPPMGDGRLDQMASLATKLLVPVIVYLVIVGVAHVVAELSGSRTLQRVVQTMTPRFLTALLITMMATATPVGAQSNSSGSNGAPTMEASTTATLTANEPPSMTIRRTTPSLRAPVPPFTVQDRHPTLPETTTLENMEPTQRPGSDSPQSIATSSSVHVVVPGEHFWSIAETVLIDSGITDPDDISIARYWKDLVEANRDRLVQPSNTDLIIPGQELLLPPADRTDSGPQEHGITVRPD